MHARHLLSYVLCFAFLLTQDGIAQMPQQIIPDGKTQTTVATNGNVTGVTSGTVRGNNGFNSFLTFNIYQGHTVNLILPTGTDNLLNLVNGERSTIDGVLNSIKNGQIGGNVFFINPYGMVVGTNGVVNVGSLVAVAPTQAFMEAFFNAVGDPSAAGTAAVLGGMVPLSSDGLIVVRGKINALGNIKLAAADVANAGAINSGAVFLVAKPDFSEVVNVRGLQTGSQVAITNGDIEIIAGRDFENTGEIASEGSSGVNGGNINIAAGNDIRLLGQSLISSSGAGQNSNAANISILANGNALLADNARLAARGGEGSGNAGSIELSARKALTITGGNFDAGAKAGAAGQIVLDPEDLVIVATDMRSNGAALSLDANNSIKIGCSTANCNNGSNAVTISTQALDGNGFSVANSGDLTITAPQITVYNDARLLAAAVNNAGTTYAGGDVTMTAKQTVDEVFGPGIATLFNLQQANAGINIGAATITGKNVTISAEATSKKTATLAPQNNPDPSDPTKNLPTTIPEGLEFAVTEAATRLLPILGRAAAAIASGTATVDIGAAQITASEDVTLKATATAEAKVDAAGVYLTYGSSDAEARVQIGNGAQITAGGVLKMNAESSNTLDVTAQPITFLALKFGEQERTQTGPTISVAYGMGTSNSKAAVEQGASLTAGTINITAKNENSFSTNTNSRAYAGTAAGFGAAVSIGDYESHSTAYVNGSAATTQAPVSAEDTTGSLTITAISNNTTQTLAEATVRENKAPETDAPDAKANDTKIGEKVDAKNTDTRAGESKQKFSAAAAVTVMNSLNEARALIGTGASVSSEGDLSLTSTATESIKLRARGESSEAQLSVGGAVLVGDYTNTAESTIGKDATVNAARKLQAAASAHVTNPTVDSYMNLALGDDWDTQRLLDLGKSAVTEFVDRITASGEEDLKGQFWDAVEQATWGPFLTTSVGSRGSASSQGGLGIGGNAEFLDIHNSATAAIADGAKVNLDPQYKTSAQAVAVTASGNVRTGNSIGVETEVEHQGSGTSVGLGGSYSDVYYQNTVRASIGDGAQVQASTVEVKADSSNLFVNWGSAGSDGNTIGIEGVFTKFKLDNITEAHIEEGAQVVAASTPAGTSSVTVKATSGNYGLLGAGVDNKTGTFGLGASVAVNEIYDTTTAYIGNSVGALTPGGKVEADDVTVDADSTSRLFSIAYAYAASKSDSEGEKKDAKQAGNSKGYGFGISGNVTLNSLTQTADAHISDAKVTAADELKVTADTNSLLAGVSGTLMMSSSGGLTGAYAQNTQNRTTKAYVERSTVGAAKAEIGADSSDLFFAFTLGGALQGKYFNVAGSINNNWSTTTTEAWAGSGTTLTSTGPVAINASNKDFIVSVAGALTTGGKLGVGAGVDIEELDNTVHASITGAEVSTTAGNIQVTSSDKQDIYSFAAAVGFANFALDGAAVVWDIDTDTQSIIGTGAKVSTPDNLLISSSGDIWLFEVAGQVAGGKDVGFGASGVVNTIDATSKATVAGCTMLNGACVGTPASISAGGNGTPTTDANRGVLLAASNSDTLKAFAAGAAGGGKAGIAGSAVVNVLTDITEASIGDGAKVNEDTRQANAGQSVALRASDDTNILSFAGGAAGGGTAGVGAGADVGVIKKTTNATIADHALLNALNDITMQALATERVISIAAVLEGGGSVGLAGAASVYTITDTTGAYVGAATLDAGDSVLIAAEDDTHLILLDGNLGGSGGTSVGASANVTDIKKTTTATTGAATITARGNGGAVAGETAAGVSANTGLFDITYASYGSSGVGEFPKPDAKTAGVLNDPVLSGHRVATPQQQTVSGLAVSATSTNDLLTLAAGGQGSGGLAVAISGAVNLMNDTTTAAIGDNARINPQTSGASEQQSVLVAAGSDYGHFGVAGGIAVAGTMAAVPGADISLLTGNTTAKIGSGTQVNALQDVTVRANAQEDLFSISGTLAGSGAFSLAGSVSFLKVDNTTTAFVDSGAVLDAGNNLQVLANDSTDTDILAGSGALGLGIGGIGGSASVTVIKKDTQAYLNGENTENQLAGARTDAHGQTTVNATSSENVEAITAAGGGGFFVGIAGAVSVELLDSDTRAGIGAGASVNQGGTAQAQNVLVSAGNTATVKSIGGTAAGSLGAGIAGSVDVGSFKNDTSATIGNSALVNAGGNIGVNATQTRTITSTQVGASGGLVGIAASVSVWGVGSQLDTESLKSSTYQGEGKEDSSYSNVQGYADDQLSSGTTSKLTGMLGNADPNASGGEYVNDAGTTVSARTTGTPVSTGLAGTAVTGTAAKVDGATLNAGGNVGVNATDSVTLTLHNGTSAGGLVGAGGSVDVTNISVNGEASLTGGVTAGGNVSVGTSLTETLTGGAYAGQAGLVGLGAAYAALTDTSTNAAYLGGNIQQASLVDVSATTLRTIDSTAGNGAIGLGAVGAAIAKSNAGGSTNAYLSEAASVGQTGAVQNLQVSSSDNTTATADSTAMSAGILSGQGAVAEATANGTTAAYLGKDAQVTVGSDVAIGATATKTVTATANGATLGGVTVGVSEADATAAPTVNTYIGESADITAHGNVNVSSRYNPIAGGVTASASTSSGTLVGVGNGSVATAESSPIVAALISKDSIVAADVDVALSSVSKSTVNASADGATLGLATLNGYTIASATVANNNTVTVEDGASLSAGTGDVRVIAETNEYANTPSVTGSGYGALNYNETAGSAWIRGATAANIAGTLSAGDELVIRALVAEEAHTNPTGAARSALASGAIVKAFAGGAPQPEGAANPGAPSSTPVDTPSVTMGANTKLTAKSVDLDAHITKLIFDANAYSTSFAIGSADPTAEARVVVTANPQVTVGAGSEITAPDSINLSAVIDSDDTLIHTTSTATAKIEATSVVGIITATAQNDTSFAPSVNVEDGATLRTSNLTVEAHGPIQADDNSKTFYTRKAVTQGTSVVNWVLTKVQSVVNAIFGWIPFVRKIIKWIFTWVAEIVHSDVRAYELGNYANAPAIHMNGTLYQGAQSNLNPYLLVDAAGNIVAATGMNALLDAIGRLVVSDITSDVQSSISLNAPGGTVDGNFDIHHNTSFDSVTVINNSDRALVFNAITPLSTNNNEPAMYVDADNTGGLQYRFISEQPPTAISIQNNSASNIIFQGAISNGSGSIAIDNANGNIVGSAANLLQVHDLSITAAHGAVGDAAAPLNISLVNGGADMAHQIAGNPTFSVIAGSGLFANITADQYASVAPANPSTYNVAADINSALVGGPVNLNLAGRVLVPQSDAEALTIQPLTVAGVFNLNNTFAAGGDVNLVTAPGTQINLNGTLASGFPELGVHIAADGTVNSGTMTWPSSVDAQAVNIGSIQQGGGHIAISGGAVLGGSGTIRVLDGYSHLAIANDSALDLVIGDLDLGQRIDGSISVNGVAAPLNASLGSITTATSGYTSGEISIQNSGASDIELLGNIANPSGLTRIDNALGSISSGGPAQLLTSAGVALTASQGGIGATAAPIFLSQSGGQVDAAALGDINLNAVSGNLRLGAITSTAGDVNLNAQGSILNGDGRTGSNIDAANISLLSQQGAIGSSVAALNVDTGSGGVLQAAAAGDVNVSATAGHLTASTVSSTLGAVTLRALAGALNASDISAGGSVILDAASWIAADQVTSGADVSMTAAGGDIVFGSITAAGDVALHASGSVLNQDNAIVFGVRRSLISPASADITAVDIDLVVDTGSIGAPLNPLRIDTAETGHLSAAAAQDINIVEVNGPLTAQAVTSGGNITLTSDGALRAGQITSAGGDINLASGGDAEIYAVTAGTGDIALTSGGSILNAAGAAQPNLTGVNLLLTANGTVGALEAWFVTAATGETEVAATGNVYLHQVKGSMIASTATSGGSIDAIVDYDPVEMERLAAADHINLLVNGGALNIDQVESPVDLRLSVTQPGGVLTIAELLAGGRITLTADTIQILKLVNTGLSPLFLDLITLGGGPNLRPVEPGVAAASSTAAAAERRAREQLDPANRPEPPNTTVTDKTGEPAASGRTL